MALGSGFAMLRALGGWKPACILGLPKSPDLLSFPSLHWMASGKCLQAPAEYQSEELQA